MQIRSRIKTGKPESDFDKILEQELLSFSMELARVLNKGLKAEDNWNAAIISISDTGNADTEFAVAHGLGRVPVGFILIDIDKAGVVYNSGTTWTVANIYLKCDVANCSIKVIVL